MNKILSGVYNIQIPEGGLTSSSDLRDFIDAVVAAINQIQTHWNEELVRLLDSLPGGNTIISDKTDDINPLVNGLDGSQIYLDNLATKISDDGRYYDTSESRPLTIKEIIDSLYTETLANLSLLEKAVSAVETSSGLTDEVEAKIGDNIFSSSEVSSSTSLDGRLSSVEILLRQTIADVFNTGTTIGASPRSTYLSNPTGKQTLSESIYDIVQALASQTENRASSYVTDVSIIDTGNSTLSALSGTSTQQFVPTMLIIECSAASGLSGDAQITLGTTVGATDLLTATTLASLQTLGQKYIIRFSGLIPSILGNLDTLSIGVVSGDSGISGRFNAYLYGEFI